MSARFMPCLVACVLADATQRSGGPPIPLGVELSQEVGATSLFVGLSDRGGGAAQAVERAEEAPVRLVRPAHVTGAAPPALAQAVEPAVVADSVVRVGLHVVAREVAERRPAREERRPPAHDVGDVVATG